MILFLPFFKCLLTVSDNDDDDELDSSGTDDLNINPEQDQYEKPDIGKS